MVTLSLFRHAKSAWGTPGLGDFERPLSPRGREAAPLMGRFMEERGLVPDLVLCSSAVRARETAELAFSAAGSKPETVLTEKLYLAAADETIRLVRDIDRACTHVMLVGHNPGFHALALMLVSAGDPKALARLGAKFPTAALAVIDFDCVWPEIAPETGTLRYFMRPRDLADS